MASVRRQTTPTGSVFFQAVWSVTGIDGKRKRFTKSFDKERDAKSHASKMELEQERRGINDGGKKTFETFANETLAHWRLKGDHAETTLDGYGFSIARLCRVLGHMQLSKITAGHVDEAFAKLKAEGGIRFSKSKKDGEQRKAVPLSGRTLLHTHRAGALVMKRAISKKMISENPFTQLAPPKAGRKKIKVMTEAEALKVQKLAELASEKHPGLDLIVALLLTCGMRRSEVLGLAFDAVDLEACTIEVFRTVVQTAKGEPVFRDHRTKSESSERTIEFPAVLVPMIKRHRAYISQQALEWGKGYQREPLLMFPYFGGTALPPGMLTTRLRQLHRQAGVSGIAPTHGFRHGMASQMVASGDDVRTVADRLGHGTVAFTLSTYVHTVEGKGRKAAEKLGNHFLKG